MNIKYILVYSHKLNQFVCGRLFIPVMLWMAVAYFPLLFSILSAGRCALELLCLLRCDIVYERADRGEENALKATGRLLELKQMDLKNFFSLGVSLSRSDKNHKPFSELRKAPSIPASVLHFT